MLAFTMLTQRTNTLAVLLLAIGLYPHCAHAQQLSAKDLLMKIAETYGRASSFSVVAEKQIDLDTDTSGEEYLSLEKYTHPEAGTHESDNIQVTLMASGSSKAKLLLIHDNKQILKNDKKEVVVVADGKFVWTLIPAQHAYTELPARSAFIQNLESDDISGANLLRYYENLLAARFRSFSPYMPWAKLEHSETLKVGKDRKECYVLTIQKQGSVQKQKLWVDKTEFTVWKSVDTTVGPEGHPGISLQTTVTVTTKQMALNPSLDKSDFVFTPPEQAKRVDSLKLSGQNPFAGGPP